MPIVRIQSYSSDFYTLRTTKFLGVYRFHTFRPSVCPSRTWGISERRRFSSSFHWFAPILVKQPRRKWVNESRESTRTYDKDISKQNTVVCIFYGIYCYYRRYLLLVTSALFHVITQNIFTGTRCVICHSDETDYLLPKTIAMIHPGQSIRPSHALFKEWVHRCGTYCIPWWVHDDVIKCTLCLGLNISICVECVA